MRELIGDGYLARFLPVQTPQGPIEALSFTSNPQSPKFVVLDENETARIIATASGFLGTNQEYLDNIITKLHQLNIPRRALRGDESDSSRLRLR